MIPKEAVALGETCTGAGTWQDCGPVERGTHAGAGLLAVLVTPWFLKNCTPWKAPTLEQFVKNCSSWQRLMMKKFVEDCFPWEGPCAGEGQECEEFSS